MLEIEGECKKYTTPKHNPLTAMHILYQHITLDYCKGVF